MSYPLCINANKHQTIAAQVTDGVSKKETENRKKKEKEKETEPKSRPNRVADQHHKP